MKILAVDSSTIAASCCIMEDQKVISRSSVNAGLTHSRTLMPMIESTLHNADLSIQDIDYLAVAAGPGSFTGVRIGVAAIKGLAFTNNTPCVSVSTIEGIANIAKGLPFEGIVCSLMDARCQQVYSALFSIQDGNITRLTDDQAIASSEIKQMLQEKKLPILLIGDGASMYYNQWKDDIENLFLAPSSICYPDAVGVAYVAEQKVQSNGIIDAEHLLPVYLRLPQAERELKAKKDTNHE